MLWSGFRWRRIFPPSFRGAAPISGLPEIGGPGMTVERFDRNELYPDTGKPPAGPVAIRERAAFIGDSRYIVNRRSEARCSEATERDEGAPGLARSLRAG